MKKERKKENRSSILHSSVMILFWVLDAHSKLLLNDICCYINEERRNLLITLYTRIHTRTAMLRACRCVCICVYMRVIHTYERNLTQVSYFSRKFTTY